MIEHLLISNRLQAAQKYHIINTRNFKQQLLSAFNRGRRHEFMNIFCLLRSEQKLQFYLRVYFLIYEIHPSLKARQTISQEQVAAFKCYLDQQGKQLAKTNEFIEFYALPFIKKPLQHLTFKSLFRKEWVNNLRQKIIQYLNEEDKRLKQNMNNMIKETSSKSNKKSLQQSNNEHKIVEMQEINHRLFEQVHQFTEKYNTLQQSHQQMIESFNTYMMQSQNKWFHLTRQLVNCGKHLIKWIHQSNIKILQQRKFIKVCKRIEKYQKFVSKQLEQLIDQSEDISIFDRYSVNDLSSLTANINNITQKAITNHNVATLISLEEYLPTNYTQLQEQFHQMQIQQQKLIMMGFVWRLLKSKDRCIRRKNTIGIFLIDIFGLCNGNYINLLQHEQPMIVLLQLFEILADDSYSRQIVFYQAKVYKNLLIILQQYSNLDHQQNNGLENQNYFVKIFQIIQSLSSKKQMMIYLIEEQTIELYLKLLKKQQIVSNEIIVENIIATLLNLIALNQGLQRLYEQQNIYNIIIKLLEHKNELIRIMCGGVIYTCLEYKKLYDLACESNVEEYVKYLINYGGNVNQKQLVMIGQKLKSYQPRANINQDENDDEFNQNDDEMICRNQNQIQNLQQYVKGYDILLSNYSLKGKQASKQKMEVEKIMEIYNKKQKQKLRKNKIKKQRIKKQKQQRKLPQIVIVKPQIQNKSKNYEKNRKKQNIQKDSKRRVLSNEKNNLVDGKQGKNYRSPPLISDQRNIKQVNNTYGQYQTQPNKERINSYQGPQKLEKFIHDRDKQQSNRSRKNIKQRSSADKPQFRIKKSISVEKIPRQASKQQKSQSDRNIEQLRQKDTKLDEQYRSNKKYSREQVLKQLNQQIKAQKRANDNTNYKQSLPTLGQIQENQLVTPNQMSNKNSRKCHIANNNEEIQVFSSKPKLRRSPPKEK